MSHKKAGRGSRKGREPVLRTGGLRPPGLVPGAALESRQEIRYTGPAPRPLAPGLGKSPGQLSLSKGVELDWRQELSQKA